MLRVANSQASQPFPQSPFSMVLWCWPSCCNGKQGFSTFNTTSHPADPGSRVRPNALGNPGIFQHTGHKASHLASHVFFCITPGKGLPHCGQFSQHCLMIIIGSLGSLFELCTFLSILLRAAQLLRITCYGNTTESQGGLVVDYLDDSYLLERERNNKLPNTTKKRYPYISMPDFPQIFWPMFIQPLSS